MKNTTKSISAISLSTVLLQTVPKAAGIESGQPIVFDSLDKLLWSIILTVQYYTLPIMAIALVLLGVKLLTNIDNSNTTKLIKKWMLSLSIVGLIIFGLSTITLYIREIIA